VGKYDDVIYLDLSYCSYGDQVVCLSSSTMNDIVLNHENLAIGLYIPQSFASNYPKDLLASMAALYCKGRNVGLQWDRNLVHNRIIEEYEYSFAFYHIGLICCIVLHSLREGY